MAALTADRNTKTSAWKGPQTGGAGPQAMKVKAATKIYAGALVMVDSTGYLVPAAPAASARGCAGRATEQIDNTSGASGALECRVEQGVFKWANGTAGEALTQADVLKTVYAIDDQTVGKVGGANPVKAGIMVALDTDGGVWVQTLLAITTP